MHLSRYGVEIHERHVFDGGGVTSRSPGATNHSTERNSEVLVGNESDRHIPPLFPDEGYP